MAKKVQVLLVDDVDKSSAADETVSFSLDGVSYEIDLTSKNATKLRDDLAVWIGHAERTGGRRSPGRSAGKGTGRKADLGAVREWARRERPQGQRPGPDLRRRPGGLRQGARLTAQRPPHAAAPVDPAGAAALMSRRHAWLTFVCGGPALPLDIGADPRSWQHAVRSQQSRWYAVDAPPQVAAAFVLQWILQVPAHAAAYAAAAGPWRADLSGLTFTVGASLVPAAVRLARLVPDDVRCPTGSSGPSGPIARSPSPPRRHTPPSSASDRTRGQRWWMTCGRPPGVRPSPLQGWSARASRIAGRAVSSTPCRDASSAPAAHGCGIPRSVLTASGQVLDDVAVGRDPLEHLVEHQLAKGVGLLRSLLDLGPRARRGDAGQLPAA